MSSELAPLLGSSTYYDDIENLNREDSFDEYEDPIKSSDSLLSKIAKCLVSAAHALSPLHEEESEKEQFERFCAKQIGILDEWKFDVRTDRLVWRFVFSIPDTEEEAAEHFQSAVESLEDNPYMMHSQGPLGAFPVHYCALIGTPYHFKLVWAMLDLDARLRRDPEMKSQWLTRCPMPLILRYYHSDIEDEDVFHGENLLHIAIVARNFEFAKKLLERAPQLMIGRCSGSFFDPGQPCYFGSTPLHFAATTDNRPLVDLILDFAPVHAKYHERSLTGVPGQKDDARCMIGSDARPSVQRLRMLDEIDVWGNNILHALVWQSSDAQNDGRATLVGMWDYLTNVQAALRRQVYRETLVPHSHTLEQALNNDGMIPLVLAADIGKRNIFLHILRKNSILNWRYGPLVCRSYPLDGLDAPPSAFPDAPCALDCLVNRGRLDFFSVSVIRRLLERKWVYYARKIFYIRLYITIIYAVVMVVTVITQNKLDPDTRPRPHPSDMPLIRTVNSLGKSILLLGAMLQFAKEFRSITESNLSDYFNENGAAFMENACNWAYFIFFGIAAMADIFHAPVGFTHAFMALSVLALSGYFFFFFLGFELTGAYIVMIGKMLMSDLARFAFAFLVFVIGFGSAFHVLFKGPSIGEYILTLRDTLLMALGQIDPDQFFIGVHTPWFCTALMFLYVMIVNVLLLNLLIATMAQTYADVLPMATLTWLLERARITQSICQEFSPNPKRHYYVSQTPPPDDGLPTEVDPTRWEKRRYLLALESKKDDEANQCVDDANDQKPDEPAVLLHTDDERFAAF